MHRIKVGWFIQDLLTNTKQANSEFRRMLAGPVDPGPFFSVSEMKPDLHPDDRGRVYGRLEQTARTGEAFREHFRLRDADGEERLVLEHASIITRGGRPIRMGMLIDISPDDIAQIRSNDYTELDTLAVSLMTVRDLADMADNTIVKHLVDMALLEIGQQLARLHKMDLPDWH